MDMRTPIVALLTTLSASVPPGPAQLETAEMDPQRVAAQFQRCGYETSPPAPLSSYPPTLLPRFTPIEPAEDVTVLVVRDRGETTREDGRSLAVLVFPDAARATAAFDEGARLVRVAVRSQAAIEAPDGLAPVVPKLDTEHGPPVFLGYGASVWRGNVAMAQLSTGSVTLVRKTTAALEARGLDPENAGAADYEAAAKEALATTKPRVRDTLRGAGAAIDHDFVDCLR
jgi:hypothetical protein